MKETIRPYGFKEPEIISDDHWQREDAKLGAQRGTLYEPIGDWTKYLPKYEVQLTNDKEETSGCTVWGWQNGIETLLKRITGKEYNFSERFNYIVAEVDLDGADPHHVAETIRDNRVIDQVLLPMTGSYEEFCTPKPMTPALLDKAAEFPYELRHWWVWTSKDNLTDEERAELIRANLVYSPMPVSVTAWKKKGDVYVDGGKPNTHWCLLYGEEPGKGWKIFDSYDHSHKVISYDHKIRYAKGFDLVKVPSNRPALFSIVALAKKVIEFYKKLLAPTPMPTPQPKPVPPPVSDTDRLIPALIKVESGGNDNAIGDKHLIDKAYGPLQIRKPCVLDVNRAFGTKYTAQGMLGNRAASIDVFKKYMALYATPAKVGRAVTMQDMARIWNGGPIGWRKPATVGYWNKVKKYL